MEEVNGPTCVISLLYAKNPKVVAEAIKLVQFISAHGKENSKKSN